VLRLWRPAVAGLAMAGVLIFVRPGLLIVAIGLGGLAYGVSLGLLGGLRSQRPEPALNVPAH
jgi:hypothetical protein